jgi:hypothetical protein
VLYNEGGGCAFDCAGQTDPLCGDGILSSADVSFHAAVGVDREVSEGDREGRGRLLRVAVTTYYRRALAGRRFATCPSLILSTKSGSPAPLTTRFDYGVQPNSAGICASIGQVSDTPTCRVGTVNSFSGAYYPIALSREQRYKPADSCAPNTRSVSDVFEASGFGTCRERQEGGHTEIYEISLDEVNNIAPSPDLDFVSSVSASNQTAAEILSRVGYLYVLFVEDPPSDFHCPSGLNAAGCGSDRELKQC